VSRATNTDALDEAWIRLIRAASDLAQALAEASADRTFESGVRVGPDTTLHHLTGPYGRADL
jgi:hypothetical protein